MSNKNWRVDPDPRTGGYAVVTEEGHTIAVVTQRDPSPTREGITNAESLDRARMMAAAPDMLAALLAVVRVADRKTDEFDLAHAAIAKATGAQS